MARLMMMFVVTTRSKMMLLVTTLLVLNVVAVSGAFTLGRYAIDLGTLVDYLRSLIFGGWQGDPEIAHVISRIRFPRLIAAIFVGGALSVAGAAYQSLFRNPLVSPDVLGASSGAGFGAALAIILGFNVTGLQIMAFSFSLAAVMISWTISKATKRDQILALVLGGIVVSALCSAGTSILKYLADPNTDLPTITFWLMGGLNGVRAVDLLPLVIPVIVCVAVLWVLRWQLDTITFGDETATALGVRVSWLRAGVIICATLLTAVSVSVSGVIGWVGLIIPHIARMLFGPQHRLLIPVAFLVGSLFLLGVDTISRTMLEAEVPLGILTALLGAPFLAWLLARNASW